MLLSTARPGAGRGAEGPLPRSPSGYLREERLVREGGLEPPRTFVHTALNCLERERTVSRSRASSAIPKNPAGCEQVPCDADQSLPGSS